MANYSTYKYLLHMPGAATGSYSRNLQYLFSHGAVVLVWRHAAIEWYYRHLVDGVHYVAVDAASLPATLAAPRLVDRWAATLGALGDRQDGGPPAFDAAAA